MMKHVVGRVSYSVIFFSFCLFVGCSNYELGEGAGDNSFFGLRSESLEVLPTLDQPGPSIRIVWSESHTVQSAKFFFARANLYYSSGGGHWLSSANQWLVFGEGSRQIALDESWESFSENSFYKATITLTPKFAGDIENNNPHADGGNLIFEAVFDDMSEPLRLYTAPSEQTQNGSRLYFHSPNDEALSVSENDIIELEMPEGIVQSIRRDYEACMKGELSYNDRLISTSECHRWKYYSVSSIGWKKNNGILRLAKE